MEDSKLLKIGDFSKLSRVSIRMLRYYDEIGILNPVAIDEFTGYRYYSEEQLVVAGRIRAFKDMGFSLSDIRDMLKCYDDTKQIEHYLEIREKDLKKEFEETAYRLKLLDTAKEWLRKDNNLMNYNVVLKTIPERKVASVNMVIPCYEDEGMIWKVLCDETDSMNLVPDDPCICCIVYRDNEFKEKDVKIEAQKSVKGDYHDTEHVKFKAEPAIEVASTIHNGSYAGLDYAMKAVADWVKENGYEISGDIFNIYHVSPHETDDENKFVTEICYPVKKK